MAKPASDVPPYAACPWAGRGTHPTRNRQGLKPVARGDEQSGPEEEAMTATLAPGLHPSGHACPPLSRFEFVSFLREGTGTTLARVRDLVSGQLCCMKHLKAGSDRRLWRSQHKQLETEFDIGRGNEHRGLRRSIEFQVQRRLWRPVEAWLVLEYVDGIPLDAFARTAPLWLLVKVFWNVADALQSLHCRGFLHADLKPANILCAGHGRPTIIDYGQACPSLTRKPRIQGTPGYMAPEQRERGILDPRTDIFGLGATMKAVLAGEVPAWGAPHDRRSHDPTLWKLINDCCEEERLRRPPDLRPVKDRLEFVYRRIVGDGGSSDGLQVFVPGPPGGHDPPARQRRTHDARDGQARRLGSIVPAEASGRSSAGQPLAANRPAATRAEGACESRATAPAMRRSVA
jgi:serine/threonine-protein kinase